MIRYSSSLFRLLWPLPVVTAWWAFRTHDTALSLPRFSGCCATQPKMLPHFLGFGQCSQKAPENRGRLEQGLRSWALHAHQASPAQPLCRIGSVNSGAVVSVLQSCRPCSSFSRIFGSFLRALFESTFLRSKNCRVAQQPTSPRKPAAVHTPDPAAAAPTCRHRTRNNNQKHYET